MTTQLPMPGMLTDAQTFRTVGQKKIAKTSDVDLFAFQCRAYKLPAFHCKPNELKFAKEHNGRLWRFDFAWPEYWLAVEIEGLVVKRIGGQTVVMGRHASITGYTEDCIKYATAACIGWTVLRFNQALVKNGTAINFTLQALGLRGWKP